jgi:hypothetical protein
MNDASEMRKRHLRRLHPEWWNDNDQVILFWGLMWLAGFELGCGVYFLWAAFR